MGPHPSPSKRKIITLPRASANPQGARPGLWRLAIKREAVIPQGKCRIIYSTAPRRPITPRRLLRLTDQRSIIETPTERVLRIVKERCPDLDLTLILKPLALSAPKPQPVKKARAIDAPAA